MAHEIDIVTLATLGGGAAMEKFDYAMREVAHNVMDLNTDPEQKREINIKVTFLPNLERGMGGVKIDVTTRLAAAKPASAMVYFARSPEGEAIATEFNRTQPMLPHFDMRKGPKTAPTGRPAPLNKKTDDEGEAH